MKTKVLISFSTLAFCFGFTYKNVPLPMDKIKKPRICVNDYTRDVQENELINCRKIQNMGVIVYLNAELETYDNFQVELHRFGTDGDVMVAYQNFNPRHKEYQKKISGKDSLKLDMINPLDMNNSDFLTNTLKFKMNKFIIENVVCTMHELQHCNFYVVMKAYNKTGALDRFGDDVFDDGVEVSERSIVFRNWEKK